MEVLKLLSYLMIVILIFCKRRSRKVIKLKGNLRTLNSKERLGTQWPTLSNCKYGLIPRFRVRLELR